MAKREGWYVPREEEPESPVWRAVSFGVLVVAAAGLMGVVFALGPYFYYTGSRPRSYSGSERRWEAQRDRLWKETKERFQLRFWLGVGVGGAGAVAAWYTIGRGRSFGESGGGTSEQ